MTNKKLKAASSLGFHVGVFTPKNSQQVDQHGYKLASKINAKESLTLQKNLLQWFSAALNLNQPEKKNDIPIRKH